MDRPAASAISWNVIPSNTCRAMTSRCSGGRSLQRALDGDALVVRRGLDDRLEDRGSGGRCAVPLLPPQCRVALVPDRPAKIVELLVEARRVPQNRGEHLVDGILGRRGIRQQHQGVAIERRAVGIVETAHERSRIVPGPVRHRVIL